MIFTLNFHDFLRTMYKICAKFSCKNFTADVCPVVWECYAIVLRGPFFVDMV